jgi:hypothetical protein
MGNLVSLGKEKLLGLDASQGCVRHALLETGGTCTYGWSNG